MKNEPNALGTAIKRSRIDQHMTQDELAVKLDVTSRYIMAIENEGKLPSFEILYKLIRALNISSDSIFYPEKQFDGNPHDRLEHMIRQCDEKQLRVLLATAQALLD